MLLFITPPAVFCVDFSPSRNFVLPYTHNTTNSNREMITSPSLFVTNHMNDTHFFFFFRFDYFRVVGCLHCKKTHTHTENVCNCIQCIKCPASTYFSFYFIQNADGCTLVKNPLAVWHTHTHTKNTVVINQLCSSFSI